MKYIYYVNILTGIICINHVNGVQEANTSVQRTAELQRHTESDMPEDT